MKLKLKPKENTCKFILLFFDFVVSFSLTGLAVTAILAYEQSGLLGISDAVFGTEMREIWWLPVIFAFMIFMRGVYSQRLTFWDETREILNSSAAAFVISMIILVLQNKTEFPYMILVLYICLTAIIHPLIRHYFKLFLVKTGMYQKRLLVIGAGEAGKAIAAGMTVEKELGFQLVGFLDDNPTEQAITIGKHEFSVLGPTRNVRKMIVKEKIDAIVIAMPSIGRQMLAKISAEVQRHTRQLYIVPEMKGISAANSELHHLFNEQLFLVRVYNNLHYLRNKLTKAMFDLTLAILLMPILLPAILLIGILIKIDSPGPVFFGHTRIGKNGRKIRVYKFRSMHKDAQERLKQILADDLDARKEWEATFKLKNDPRITRAGNILRKTSLDELPQFFNVLKGDMSFVGPRPVVEEEIVNYYKENARFYNMVKPGITGLWQVSGRSDTSYERRIDLDNWYVLNWSLWLDIVILFKTIRVVLKLDGAY